MSPQFKFLPFITALYVTLSQVSYVLAYKMVPIQSFLLPAGVIAFLLVYTISDIVAEVYGYKRARRLIWESVICGFVFMSIITLLLRLPSSNSVIYNEVLGKTWRIYSGITIGVTIGSFVNLYLFSKWKIWVQGRYFMIRSFVSTSIGEIVVTAFTDSIAFFGIVPAANVTKIVLTIYCYKVLYAFLAAIPAVAIMRYLKKSEQLDVYDYSTNFNPFRMTLEDDHETKKEVGQIQYD